MLFVLEIRFGRAGDMYFQFLVVISVYFNEKSNLDLFYNYLPLLLQILETSVVNSTPQ